MVSVREPGFVTRFPELSTHNMSAAGSDGSPGEVKVSKATNKGKGQMKPSVDLHFSPRQANPLTITF
jgi:hypothetical protein